MKKHILIAVILAGCMGNPGSEKKASDSVSASSTVREEPSVKYTLQKIEKKNNGCGDKDKVCALFFAEFPIIETAATPAVKDSITKAISNHILEPVFGDKEAKDIDDLTNTYFGEFEKEKKSPEGIDNGWDVARVAAVERNTPVFFSLLLNEDSYVGGAHPNVSSYYVNIDAHSGSTLKLDDILQPGAKERLTAIGEEIFRKEKKLTANARLDENYWFKNGKFSLTTNFLIEKEGLLFFYNTYEIGPYSEGPTDLRIPFERIKDLVKPEYIK